MSSAREPLGDAVIRYELVSDAVWADELRSGSEIVPADEDWDLRGACPRCGHSLSRRIVTGGTATYRLARDEPARVRLLVRCNCGSDHPGRPDGSVGCGAYGEIELEW